MACKECGKVIGHEGWCPTKVKGSPESGGGGYGEGRHPGQKNVPERPKSKKDRQWEQAKSRGKTNFEDMSSDSAKRIPSKAIDHIQMMGNKVRVFYKKGYGPTR